MHGISNYIHFKNTEALAPLVLSFIYLALIFMSESACLLILMDQSQLNCHQSLPAASLIPRPNFSRTRQNVRTNRCAKNTSFVIFIIVKQEKLGLGMRLVCCLL